MRGCDSTSVCGSYDSALCRRHRCTCGEEFYNGDEVINCGEGE